MEKKYNGWRNLALDVESTWIAQTAQSNPSTKGRSRLRFHPYPLIASTVTVQLIASFYASMDFSAISELFSLKSLIIRSVSPVYSYHSYDTIRNFNASRQRNIVRDTSTFRNRSSFGSSTSTS